MTGRCESCDRPSMSLDRDGWCRRCNRENGWVHYPAPDRPTPTPTVSEEQVAAGGRALYEVEGEGCEPIDNIGWHRETEPVRAEYQRKARAVLLAALDAAHAETEHPDRAALLAHAEEAMAERDEARAALAALRERIEGLARDMERQPSTEIAPVRGMAPIIRALAATPSETAAGGRPPVTRPAPTDPKGTR